MPKPPQKPVQTPTVSKQADSSPRGLTSALLSLVLHHLKTVYLLTYADIHQFILPTFLFGLSTSLSPTVQRPAPFPSSNHLSLASTVARIPQALLWIWSNTIIFDLCNQRNPASIREDRINKPWRPIPSGRLTPMQNRRWTLYAVPITYALSCALGAGRETPGMYLLLWMYNDLGGSDEHWIPRNTMNAVGYVWCSVGMVAVLRDQSRWENGLSRTGWIWCGIICGAIASTMQVQDLRDLEGDRSVGRKTMPLVLGETAARWVIVGAMTVWSCVCCSFWMVGWEVWVIEGLLTGAIVLRLLWMRNPGADSDTYNLWGLWLSFLYVLPLCYDPSVLRQLWSRGLST